MRKIYESINSARICDAAEEQWYGYDEMLTGPFPHDSWRLKRMAMEREGSYCYQTQLNHTDNR